VCQLKPCADFSIAVLAGSLYVLPEPIPARSGRVERLGVAPLRHDHSGTRRHGMSFFSALLCGCASSKDYRKPSGGEAVAREFNVGEVPPVRHMLETAAAH
jgi:hypothetical protein